MLSTATNTSNEINALMAHAIAKSVRTRGERGVGVIESWRQGFQDAFLIQRAALIAQFSRKLDGEKILSRAETEALNNLIRKQPSWLYGQKWGMSLHGSDPIQKHPLFNRYGWANPLHWLTCVRFWMAAQDVYSGGIAAESAKAAMAQIQIVRESSPDISPVALQREVARKMGWGEHLRPFAAQAREEADAKFGENEETMKLGDQFKKFLWRNKRMYELAGMEWGESVREEARHFAGVATFNQSGGGILSYAAHLINMAKEADNTALRIGADGIFLFTNVTANVGNSIIANSPLGYFNAISGKIAGERDGNKLPTRDMTEEERDMALYRASQATLIGAGVLVAMFASLKKWQDEPEEERDPLPYLSLTSRGPQDYGDKERLYAIGWRPYSIKIGNHIISYRGWTPLLLPLSTIGRIMDQYYFDDPKKIMAGGEQESTFIGRLAEAQLMALPTTIRDETFLRQFATLGELVSQAERRPGNESVTTQFTRFAANYVTGLVPNLWKQIDRVYDPKLRRAETPWQVFMAELPVARRGVRAAVNVLGDDISLGRARTLEAAFPSKMEGDKTFQFLAARNIPLGRPDIKIWDFEKNMQRGMTEDERYDFIKIWGPMMRKELELRIPVWKSAKTPRENILEEIRKFRTKKGSGVNDRAKAAFLYRQFQRQQG